MKSLIVALLLIASIPAYPRPQTNTRVMAGFMKGNDYLAMNAGEKRAYAMGVINGMLLAGQFGAPEAKLKWFEDCVRGMNNEQVSAIVTKYLHGNPAQWHVPMNLLSYDAMIEACPHSPKL